MKLRATVLALLIAGVGAFLLWTYLRRFEAEASGGPLVGVLVSMRTMEPGSVLRKEDIGERWIPQAYVETRAIRMPDRQRIENLRIATPMQAQQTLMWTDIVVPNDDKQDYARLVQPGMRAVTIHVEGRDTALVRPGSRVDVVGTFQQPGSVETRTAVVLFQNVLVLGRGSAGSADGRMASEGSDLALSLSLQQDQILQLAGDKGKLSVALRSPEEVGVQEGLGEISSNVLVEAQKLAAAARPKQGPARLDSAVAR